MTALAVEPTTVRPLAPAPDPGCPSTTRHGDKAAYTHHGCACLAAVADHARYRNILRLEQVRGAPSRLVDATGTVRRLQALMTQDWPARLIAPEIGCGTGQAVTELIRQRRVRRVTAERVSVVYDVLSSKRGPSRETGRRALAKGWAPPLAWDDDTIDDPAAQPDRGRKVSRDVALWEDSEWLIRTQGYTVDTAASRLGVSRDYLEVSRSRAVRRLTRDCAHMLGLDGWAAREYVVRGWWTP